MILAIESSCDESALALFDPLQGITWESVWSQTATHARHGGVVPELAVREHLKKFPELMREMEEFILKGPSPSNSIAQVAVTVGPGLAGSLAMGMALGKALALEKNIPLLGVNHLRAHAWSVFMNLHKSSPEVFHEALKKRLPHLGILVSGGNTLLYEINAQRNLKILAKTVDDAAGEALDKAAKMLGLPYPGAPLMEKLAIEGDATKFEFPIPFKESPDLKFSFSGMKTAMRYRLQKMSADEVELEKKNLAASFQSAVVAGVALMVKRALKRGIENKGGMGATPPTTIPFPEGGARGGPYVPYYRSLGLCGGVAQNSALRSAIENLARDFGAEFLPAERKHCGDNAAMIAFAAWADPAGLRKVESFEPGLTVEG